MGIARDRLIQRFNGLQKIVFAGAAKGRPTQQRVSARVKIESREIGGGRSLDCGLLRRRKFGAQLISNGFGNLSLDRKNVIQWPVVMLGPKMNILARIEQLRADAHTIAGALHTTFEDVRNAKFPCDLAEIASNASLVLHHAYSADHLQIRYLRQVRQDFVLYAI